MTKLDIADNAFAVLKAQPRLLTQLVLPLVVPLIALQTYERRSDGGGSFVDFFDSPGRFGAVVGRPVELVLFALDLLVLSLAGVLVARLVSLWFLEGLPTARRVWIDSLRIWPRAFVAFIAVHTVELVTLGLTVPLFIVCMPVLCIERAGPFAALRRSAVLVRRDLGGALGLVLLSAFLVAILGFLLGWLPLSISRAFEDNGYLIAGVASAAIETITTSFVALGAVVYYFDLRIRVEGMDIELNAQECLRG